MEKVIENQTVQDSACYYVNNGYHCAEAVAASVLEQLGQDPVQAVAHATAFGGGFSRSFIEACGALSGALIVIGHLYPRREMGRPWDVAAELGSQMRERFVSRYGTTCCKSLRDRFGEAQSEKCAALTGETAAGLIDLLQEYELNNKNGS